jgi:hypothetical protein
MGCKELHDIVEAHLTSDLRGNGRLAASGLTLDEVHDVVGTLELSFDRTNK